MRITRRESTANRTRAALALPRTGHTQRRLLPRYPPGPSTIFGTNRRTAGQTPLPLPQQIVSEREILSRTVSGAPTNFSFLRNRGRTYAGDHLRCRHRTSIRFGDHIISKPKSRSPVRSTSTKSRRPSSVKVETRVRTESGCQCSNSMVWQRGSAQLHWPTTRKCPSC